MSDLEKAIFYFDFNNCPQILGHRTTIDWDGDGYVLGNEITVKIADVKKPITFKLYYDDLGELITGNYNIDPMVYDTLMSISNDALNDMKKYMEEESHENNYGNWTKS